MTTAPVLVVIDVQNGYLDPYWGPSNNPECEDNCRRLVSRWRDKGLPIVLVQHTSASTTSPLRPGQPGHDFQPGIEGPADLVVVKTVHSSFYGTPDLGEWLSTNGYRNVIICGIMTNYCCETTARMAGNLGYDVEFVLDATRTFDQTALDGSTIPADTVAAVTAANLNGEFATIVSTAELLARQA